MLCDKSFNRIKNIFDRISPYYDFMNNLISLGSHFWIKLLSVKMLHLKSYSKVLDLCCGTGDISKIILRQYPKVKVIGLDCSVDMLKIAKCKNPKGTFISGNCEGIPFGDKEFDIVTIGFGLRNIQDRAQAIAEIYRVLKNDGEFLHLDFGQHNIFSGIFDLLVKFFIKIFGKDEESYLYLIQSKKEYPEPLKLIKEFETAGFKMAYRRDFIFGVISAQVFTK